MSMLITHHNELLRQRFGVMAHRPCRDLSDSEDGDQHPKRQYTLSPYAKAHKSGSSGGFLYAALWLGLGQLTLN